MASYNHTSNAQIFQFGFSEELTDFQQRIRTFAQHEIKPNAAKYDATAEFPLENVKALAKEGLMGMTVPNKYGGTGKDMLSFVIAIEEISAADATTAIILAVHNSVGLYPIYVFGTEEQRQRFVVPLAKGEKLAAFALTEPIAGSDAASLKTQAVLDGDEYVLNGAKIFITNGSVADTVLVLARTEKSARAQGVSAFIVEKGTEGFCYGAKEHKMGIHASDTSELIFENCRVPVENRLGEEGEGFRIAMRTLDSSRIGVGAQALGIARAAYEESVQYAKNRIQFGRPIAMFQAIQWKLVDMATSIDAARLLIHRAAFLKDQNLPFVKEASMAKLYASKVAVDTTINAVQIQGMYGCRVGNPVERYFREAKVTEIYEGTSEIQRLVIAKTLLQ